MFLVDESSVVDKSSVPLGSREFSGRREFCPLVDESSVLMVDESSVLLGRREFMDPPCLGTFKLKQYIIVRTLKNNRGDLAKFFTERSMVEKPKCLAEAKP